MGKEKIRLVKYESGDVMRNVKKYIVILLVVVVAAVLIIRGINIQSVEDYYTSDAESDAKNSIKVTLSIDCKLALQQKEMLNNRQIELIGDGVILEESEFLLEEGSSVYDLLVDATRVNKIQMEYQGSEGNIYNSIYIQGINYLYEFDCGDTSGWIYLVNGEQTNKGCSEYTLSDGDKVCWVYSLNLGQDVEEYYGEKK